MQKSDSNMTAKTVRRRAQGSTTLNRRYVRRPSSGNVVVPVKRKSKGDETRHEPVMMQQQEMMAQVKTHPIQMAANSRMQKRQNRAETKPKETKVSAKELKEQAIQKALAEATMKDSKQEMISNKKAKKSDGVHFGFGRVMLALSCAAAAVFAIAYFVNLNMPDISLRVAAMQTGIDASYPGYVPRDYNVSSITSENGKVTMEFTNVGTEDSFTLIEEASSWDSNALMTNYVKEEFGENYNIVREQGLTIYISGSNAAWVNGGVVYKIMTTSGELSNKQIKSIATSL